MKSILWSIRHIRILFVVVLLPSVYLNLFGFAFMEGANLIWLKIIYFTILGLTLISIYISQGDRINIVVLFLLPILLILSNVPYKTYTLISIFIVYIITGLKIGKKVLLSLIYVPIILLGLFGIWLGEFGKDTTLKAVYSPNGQYRVDVIDSDQGALGGDTYINLYKVYYKVIQKNEKLLYHGHWGENPSVKWADNENILINGKKINIYNSKTWKTKK